MKYYLGVDVGATKTHALVADEAGHVVGFGEAGPGNHESVGYDGFQANLQYAVTEALKGNSLSPAQIHGAGFGVGGYDWPVEREPMLQVISTLGLSGEIELVNDSELGILLGSPRGWGVAVVSGTGCNCRGWNADRSRLGRVTGGGLGCGECAGASELMTMVMHALAHEWTGRGPATALSKVYVGKYGVKDLTELVQDFVMGTKSLDSSDVLLFFQVAAQGDPVALDLIRWAGSELGEMANAVIHQLDFEDVDFDLVLIGSMFDGSPLLAEVMQKTVWKVAPKANFIRAKEPPVVGAVLLGMEAAHQSVAAETRGNIIRTLPLYRKKRG